MRLIGLGTLLALVVVGCGEPLKPSDFAGTYALRAVGGSPLPVTVPVLSNGGTISFGGGGLVLSPGNFSLVLAAGQSDSGVANSGSFGILVNGTLAGRAYPLTARAVDPTSSVGETIELAVSISGANAVVTLPAGALRLVRSTTMVFGPRQ